MAGGYGGGLTPLLLLASLAGSAVVIGELLARGADINGRCANGRTALYYARRFIVILIGITVDDNMSLTSDSDMISAGCHNDIKYPQNDIGIKLVHHVKSVHPCHLPQLQV